MIELLNVSGDDLMVVNAARVSYGKTKGVLDEKDSKLISYLVNHGHTSPFRHPHLSFRITCPIYVERQLFKHQVGWTANSISGRYVDFSDTYSVPTQLRLQSKDSKQGSSGLLPSDINDELVARMQKLVNDAADLYAELVKHDVAKEQARVILPLCLNTSFVWTGSFQAFMHLCGLRIKPDAQQETREVVQEMLDRVKELPSEPFKYSIKAFGF